MTLKAFDSMGQEVKFGDKILSFQGKAATFVLATRAKTPERSGKVVVRWANSDSQQEYYESVFDLIVKDAPI